MTGEDAFLKKILICLDITWLVLGMMGFLLFVFWNPQLFISNEGPKQIVKQELQKPPGEIRWSPPDTSSLPRTPEANLIRYGRELVSRTSIYLGPKGKVAQVTNGMNCQNCHLEAGTKFYGNNYSAVASTYPKFRARSGTIESVERRVNDCIERSLNGKALQIDSKEMSAFVAYILWVGESVPKDSVPNGAGLLKLKFLDRAANVNKGEIVFKTHCVRCHGADGQGQLDDTGAAWKYPPLQGSNSYNVGAGLFRLSRFAGYVKANMPNDIATLDKPVLTDEQAWDVAAYVNSLPRPTKKFPDDWPDITQKPFDHPFGPYADAFSEEQHKYGPFDKMAKSK